ncbi:MAG: DNA polymerase III subunit delta [Treponemataceae bacterium]
MAIPFYLYKGPEFGEKNDAVQQLKSKAEKQFPSVEFKTFYATETTISDVLAYLSNGSLFSDARFVVLKNAELIKKKDEIQLLADWANACSNKNFQDSILVLITDENSVEAKLEKLFPKENVKMFWEMFENRKIPWITDFFRKNGFQIEIEAAQIILNLVENNTEALKNECSRFFVCLKNDRPISADDVQNILTHNREENAFTLFAALVDGQKSPAKRLENSLEILQKIRQSKDSNSTALLAGLLYAFKQLKKWLILCSQGIPDSIELKKNGFASVIAQNQYKNASRIWNLQQVQKIIAAISASDMQIRHLGTSSENNFLEILLYRIVIKNGTKTAEYDSEI